MAEQIADEEFDDELIDLVEQIVRRRATQRRTADPASARPPAPEATEAAVEEAVAEASPVSAEEPDTPDAEDAEPVVEPAVGRRRLPRPRVTRTGAVIAGLSVALAGAGGVAVADHLSAASGSGDRLPVEQQASLVATTLYTYDYRNVSGYLKAQAGVLTKAAQTTVKPNWASLTAMIQSGRYVSQPQIQQVYVGDVTKDRAAVLVVTDIKLTTTDGILDSVGATLQFTLVREGGRWLANEIPTLLTPGTQTATDLKGNPIKTSPTPAPSSTPKS